MKGKEYKQLLFLTPYIKRTKYKFLVGIIGMIISSLIVTPIPYLIGYSIDNIILKNKNYYDLLKISLLMMLIYAFVYLINIGYTFIFSKVQYEVINRVRINLMDSVIDLPLNYHNKNDKGYILGRVSETGNLGVLFSPTFLGTLTGFFDLIFSLFVMFKLSPILTFITIALLPLYYLVSRSASKKISDSTKKVYESSALLNGEIFETLNGIEEIKLLNGKKTQINKFNRKLVSMTKNLLKQNLNFIFFIQNIILSNNLITTSVLFFSGVLILNNHLSIGIYTSFSLYLSKLLSTTQVFGSLEITLKPVCISIERIKSLLEIEKESSAEFKTISFENNVEKIQFNNISYKYENADSFVFKDLNIELNKGDKVLIRGINGSGKTTLIKLITGLYKPISGKILINELDYSLINITSFRSRIGIVSQNVFLFKGTVSENILFGQNDVAIEEITNKAKKYNLMEYLNSFDKGLETEISQNGFGLSGGQVQVIAFLRAIITERDVIILDESTSNLDINTKDLITKLLNDQNLCSILIIISHQEEGYEFINKIIDLNQHNELKSEHYVLLEAHGVP